MIVFFQEMYFLLRQNLTKNTSILTINIVCTKLNQNRPWQAHKTEYVRKIGIWGGGASPINTDLLDRRYLETASAELGFYWCHRQLSPISWIPSNNWCHRQLSPISWIPSNNFDSHSHRKGSSKLGKSDVNRHLCCIAHKKNFCKRSNRQLQAPPPLNFSRRIFRNSALAPNFSFEP